MCFAFSALAVIGSPALAATVTRDCYNGPTGTSMGVCGYWEVYDNSVGKKGAVCVYDYSSPYYLNRITIRPPLMHGYYSYKTKVGWRFIVQTMPTGGGSWHNDYTSSWQTAKANDSIPAYVNHGFSRRAWPAATNPSGYYYRILIDLAWWRSGLLQGYTE